MKTAQELNALIDNLNSNLVQKMGVDLSLEGVKEVVGEILSQKLQGEIKGYVSALNLEELIKFMAILNARIASKKVQEAKQAKKVRQH